MAKARAKTRPFEEKFLRDVLGPDWEKKFKGSVRTFSKQKIEIDPISIPLTEEEQVAPQKIEGREDIERKEKENIFKKILRRVKENKKLRFLFGRSPSAS